MTEINTADSARGRLLHAALGLFAHQGFAKTSTREIAESAGTNLAAIRSTTSATRPGCTAPCSSSCSRNPRRKFVATAARALSLRDALRGLYLGFLEPLKQGELTTLCMKLHMREMLEPTGLWSEEIEQGIRPMHEALVRVLCRHVGVTQPDEHITRLAVCVAALGVHLHVGRDVTDALAPALNNAPDAFDRWLDALVMYAEAMVAAEVQRRATG